MQRPTLVQRQVWCSNLSFPPLRTVVASPTLSLSPAQAKTARLPLFYILPGRCQVTLSSSMFSAVSLAAPHRKLSHLSTTEENKRKMVRGGATRLLVKFISDYEDSDKMTDRAIAMMRNLVTIEEGRVSFVAEGGIK